MYSLYKTVHPPTGIDNSVYCNFIDSKETNLCISSANKLQIYKFYNNNNNQSDFNLNNNNKIKLELVETFNLFGNISCLKSCRYGSMNKDALIIAFSDAKLSIVEYNNDLGDLVTLSIHYFEDEFENEGNFYNIYQPILKVDPNMRCACMLIYGFKLVVIPFYSENNSNSKELENSLKQDQEDNIKKNQYSLSSYTIDLRKLDNWLEMRIIDIEFLFGYYEPTLFILCESNMTWVGRYAVKKDTCNSVALSLNLNQKTHPVIWPVDKLPSSCIKCYAVPAPIGGVLIFAVNSLIYINQSVPSHAVSLNSLASRTSNYPFKNNLEDIKIALDSSQAIFISQDRLCVSLKGGELYIITLITDSESLRSVRSFNIEKCANSVISTCLTKCFDNYLFVGSRLGNSVLLRYSLNTNTNINTMNNNINNSNSNNNSNNISLSIYNSSKQELNEANIDSNMNQEENKSYEKSNEEMNEESSHEPFKIKTSNLLSNLYTFEICDVLLNIAPCGHSIIGESVGDYSEYESNVDSKNINELNHIDLITSSGYTKNGAISILQRSLRPDLIATFQIQDIIDMWSVNLNNTTSQDSINDQNILDDYSITYLFLTKIDSTIILQIGNEITELDKETCIFCTKEPTLYCSNLNKNKFIIQITTKHIYVYCTSTKSSQDVDLVYEFDLIESNPSDSFMIKEAYILDPYICLLNENGKINFYYFDLKTVSIKPYKFEDETLNEDINCFSIYEDLSSLFSTQLNFNSFSKSDEKKLNDLTDNNLNDKVNGSKPALFNYDSDIKMNEVFDEDELLYGTSINENQPYNEHINKLLTENINKQQFNLNNDQMTQNLNVQTNNFLKIKTSWLFLVKLDGTLLILNINSVEQKLKLILNCSKFNLAPKTLITQKVCEKEEMQYELQQQQIDQSQQGNFKNSNVNEILLISCGTNEKNKCILVSRIDEDLIIYEAFLTNDFKLNFKRLNHEIIIRDKKNKNTQKKSNQDKNAEKDEIKFRTKKVPFLRKFDNIAGGLNGFTCIGSSIATYLIFYCPRSGLTPHPLWVDSNLPFLSFTTFKNSSITLSGFIYINKNFDIRICTLPVDDCNGKLQIYYDSNWILKKIQIRQTVNYLCYHEESKTYAVCYNQSEHTNKLMQLGDEDKEVVEFQKEENFIYPTKAQFHIQIYTPLEWEPLPLGKYQLHEWEHVSCLKIVHLPYEGHSSGIRSYLAASTINCYSEDVNSRGRILLFDVIETVPEPDKPLTNTKMKIILEKDQKGPVTCLESVNGRLIGCVGQKIYIWEFKNNELIGKAFIDTHFYVHKMITLKNFVLIADLHRSISLVRFQEEYTKLSFVAKDKHFIDTYACEYLVDNSNLGFIATDSEKNLSVYMYQNESHDNQGGNWLIRKAEFNVGSHINSMFRIKCRVTDPNFDKRSSLAYKRQVTYCTNLDGGIGYVLPISEKTFRRLFILQNAITIMKPHYAGLNPKSYRKWRGRRKELLNAQKNILDGDLLFEFFNFSYNDRNEIAKKIKTNTDLLLDDLTEVFQLTCHF